MELKFETMVIVGFE